MGKEFGQRSTPVSVRCRPMITPVHGLDLSSLALALRRSGPRIDAAEQPRPNDGSTRGESLEVVQADSIERFPMKTCCVSQVNPAKLERKRTNLCRN